MSFVDDPNEKRHTPPEDPRQRVRWEREKEEDEMNARLSIPDFLKVLRIPFGIERPIMMVVAYYNDACIIPRQKVDLINSVYPIEFENFYIPPAFLMVSYYDNEFDMDLKRARMALKDRIIINFQRTGAAESIRNFLKEEWTN